MVYSSIMGIRLIFISIYVLIFSFFVYGYNAFLGGEVISVSLPPLVNVKDMPSNEYVSLREEYGAIVEKEGASQAISALKEHAEKDTLVSAVCHDILHEIGKETYRKDNDLAQSLSLRDDFCNSGYLHGVFEAYFSDAPEPLSGIGAVCSSYGEAQRPFDLWQCNHGLGHGLMYYTDGSLAEALSLCSEVVAPPHVSDCQNGVYMELFNGEFLAGENTVLSEYDNNPFAICQAQEVAVGFCYTYIPVYLSGVLDMEYVDIFDICSNAGLMYQDNCVVGVGAEAMKRNMSEPGNVFSLCDTLKDRSAKHVCVRGAVDMYLNQTASVEAALNMCTVAYEAFTTTCRAAVEAKKDTFVLQVGT
jgi:hypothetical protein